MRARRLVHRQAPWISLRRSQSNRVQAAKTAEPKKPKCVRPNGSSPSPARLTGLAILGSLKRKLGSLSRIACWTRVFGMVNSAPGFTHQPAVINGFTDLIVSVFGQEQGSHARSAVGLAELPFRIPVEIEGEVELKQSDA